MNLNTFNKWKFESIPKRWNIQFYWTSQLLPMVLFQVQLCLWSSHSSKSNKKVYVMTWNHWAKPRGCRYVNWHPFNFTLEQEISMFGVKWVGKVVLISKPKLNIYIFFFSFEIFRLPNTYSYFKTFFPGESPLILPKSPLTYINPITLNI